MTVYKKMRKTIIYSSRHLMVSTLSDTLIRLFASEERSRLLTEIIFL